MYKEVTIDPECFSDYSYYTLLKKDFGFEKGRYLSIPVKSWVKEAVQAVKSSDIGDVKQQSIKRYLNQLQQGKISDLVLLTDKRKDIACDKVEQWLRWYPEQEGYRAFSAKLSEKKQAGYIDHTEVLEEHPNWNISPTLQVLRTTTDLVTALEPIVALSNKIIIVDSYFRFASNPTLLKLLECAITNNIKSIEIITSMDTVNHQSVFDNQYRQLVGQFPKIEIFKIQRGLIHDRYFITDCAAIKSGQGFSADVIKGIPADYASFNLASIKECEHVMTQVVKSRGENPDNLTNINTL